MCSPCSVGVTLVVTHFVGRHAGLPLRVITLLTICVAIKTRAESNYLLPLFSNSIYFYLINIYIPILALHSPGQAPLLAKQSYLMKSTF
jgi:hypothetical protein